jgi:hypothetical protein
MKRLKDIKFRVDLTEAIHGKDQNYDTSYFELFLLALNTQSSQEGQGGISPLDMEVRLVIIGKIKSAQKNDAGNIILENSELKDLTKLVKRQKFAHVDQNFLDYRKYVVKRESDEPDKDTNESKKGKTENKT